MAAYGSYQGWNGLLQFEYSGGDWADQISGDFDLGNKPHVLSTWPAAARLFLAEHVKPGGLVDRSLPGERVEQGVPIEDGLPRQAGLQHRLAFHIARRGEAALPSTLSEATGAAATDTGQLRWDGEAGLVTVDSPQTAGRVGFSAAPTHVGPVTLDLTPEFSVATVTALDGKPLGESGHLLITATARAENSGMV